ncbi:MAG: hypothetical protein ACK4N5_13250, partial [Myxococcales bacterium]
AAPPPSPEGGAGMADNESGGNEKKMPVQSQGDSWRAGSGDLQPRDELRDRMGPVVEDGEQERGIYPGTTQDDPTR